MATEVLEVFSHDGEPFPKTPNSYRKRDKFHVVVFGSLVPAVGQDQTTSS